MKLNINNFNLHEQDDLIEINREVDVGKYLPQDIIGKGLEFQNIRLINNFELSRLWAQANKIMNNLYIHRADQAGIDAYIKLIDEEILGDLDSKRKQVFTEWNRQIIWTHRTLEDYLINLLGYGKFKIELEYDDYNIIINVLVNNPRLNNVSLAKSLRKIIPANLQIDIRILMVEKLIFKDSYAEYETKFWMTNQIPSGRVPTQSYKGIKIRDRISMNPRGRITDNRPYRTKQINSGGGSK